MLGGVKIGARLTMTGETLSADVQTGAFLPLAGGTMTGTITSTAVVNPLLTAAESWIGPSSTAGVYFKGGNVGIGTTTPTAYLHLKASTASANTGALKFTAGVLATTPEAGLIEFDGTSWYLNV